VKSPTATQFHFSSEKQNYKDFDHDGVINNLPYQLQGLKNAAVVSPTLHLRDQGTGKDVRLEVANQRKPNRQSGFRDWWNEIAILLFSSGLLAAIAIILHKNNHEKQSVYKGVNLTTLIAVISTILRASMMTAVEESENRYSRSCKYMLIPPLSYWSDQMGLVQTSPSSK
jgi:hypothetical protein